MIDAKHAKARARIMLARAILTSKGQDVNEPAWENEAWLMVDGKSLDRAREDHDPLLERHDFTVACNALYKRLCAELGI